MEENNFKQFKSILKDK